MRPGSCFLKIRTRPQVAPRGNAPRKNDGKNFKSCTICWSLSNISLIKLLYKAPAEQAETHSGNKPTSGRKHKVLHQRSLASAWPWPSLFSLVVISSCCFAGPELKQCAQVVLREHASITRNMIPLHQCPELLRRHQLQRQRSGSPLLCPVGPWVEEVEGGQVILGELGLCCRTIHS